MTEVGEVFDIVTTAQYMGIASVFEHMVKCEECRKKSYEIVYHTKKATEATK